MPSLTSPLKTESTKDGKMETWNDNERSHLQSGRTALLLTHRKQIAEGNRRTQRKVAMEEFFLPKNESAYGVDHLFPIRQGEPNKDRLGHRRQASKVCAITDKLVEDSEEERWKDVRTNRLQDAAQDREVLAPPRKKVREEVEEMPKGVRRAWPTKFPPTLRVGDVPVHVKVPPQRQQPPLVEHAAAVWEAASTCSDAWRTTPPTWMWIRNEDEASMMRLRNFPGQRAASTSKAA